MEGFLHCELPTRIVVDRRLCLSANRRGPGRNSGRGPGSWMNPLDNGCASRPQSQVRQGPSTIRPPGTICSLLKHCSVGTAPLVARTYQSLQHRRRIGFPIANPFRVSRVGWAPSTLEVTLAILRGSPIKKGSISATWSASLPSAPFPTIAWPSSSESTLPDR